MRKQKKKKSSNKITKQIKNIISPEEKAQKLQDAAFRRKIRTVFTDTGFEYFKTDGKNLVIGNRTVELDFVFLFENIFLICEDTTTKRAKRDHIRNKMEAFTEINKHHGIFLEKMKGSFPECKDKFSKYLESRYKFFFLYFSQNELNLSDRERKLYPIIKFVEPRTLNYFSKISKYIRLSARYEIFRFLNLDNNDIGASSSDSTEKTITAPIIYPEDYTGLTNGVRIISFMISADILLRTCYVLRKDNWEESIWLYQRLIDKDKIKKIRRYICRKSEAFYNNIIVALPDDIKFTREANGCMEYLTIDQIGNHDTCKLIIPDRFNSLCIIDGQHRIFAHYEGEDNDEGKIALLRKRLHLLVTGLVFPKNMSQIERSQIQSEIFLDINSNAKPVPADVLLHIEMVKNPLSDIGIARQVIEKLNKDSIFRNKFGLTAVEESKIKVASIIKFALRYLVTIEPQNNKSFFNYWKGDIDKLKQKDDNTLKEYVDFCAQNLDIYFSAIHEVFKTYWDDNESKILSVISINGFIIAYQRQLQDNGIQDRSFYIEKIKNLKIDFSKDNFKYTSSQYRKFSDEIINEAFKK